MQSPNEPVQRLLSTLEASLDSAGWTQRLVEESRERTSEDDARKRSSQSRTSTGHSTQDAQQQHLLAGVINASRPLAGQEQPAVAGLREGESGSMGQHVVPYNRDELQIPQHVVDAAVRLLKEELEQLCEVDDDQYVDWRTTL